VFDLGCVATFAPWHWPIGCHSVHGFHGLHRAHDFHEFHYLRYFVNVDSSLFDRSVTFADRVEK
jgi:hypothetical protein